VTAFIQVSRGKYITTTRSRYLVNILLHRKACGWCCAESISADSVVISEKYSQERFNIKPTVSLMTLRTKGNSIKQDGVCSNFSANIS